MFPIFISRAKIGNFCRLGLSSLSSDRLFSFPAFPETGSCRGRRIQGWFYAAGSWPVSGCRHFDAGKRAARYYREDVWRKESVSGMPSRGYEWVYRSISVAGCIQKGAFLHIVVQSEDRVTTPRSAQAWPGKGQHLDRKILENDKIWVHLHPAGGKRRGALSGNPSIHWWLQLPPSSPGNRPTDTKQTLPTVGCLTLTNNGTGPV